MFREFQMKIKSKLDKLNKANFTGKCENDWRACGKTKTSRKTAEEASEIVLDEIDALSGQKPECTLHKKLSFSLRISAVNVTKSVGN